MDSFGLRIPQFIQIGSFAGFYLFVESLNPWTHVHLFQLASLEIIVLLLISFLNLIPAGIFSLMITSLLPVKLACSNTTR